MSPFQKVDNKKWTRITLAVIEEEQRRRGTKTNNTHGKLLIPETLVNKFLWQKHFELGHTGRDNELLELERYVSPKEVKVREVLQTIRSMCLNCDLKPKLVRRPVDQIMHAKVPNALLHVDYLYLYQGYVLVLVDDLSRKVELVATNTADARTGAQAIVYWKARFVLRRDLTILSDNGSHFANEMLRELEEQLRVEHRFSVAYSPWTNGSAESVNNSKILSLFRSLLSEYMLTEEQWREVLPIVMCYLNNTRSAVTGLSPNEVFIGLACGQCRHARRTVSFDC